MNYEMYVISDIKIINDGTGDNITANYVFIIEEPASPFSKEVFFAGHVKGWNRNQSSTALLAEIMGKFSRGEGYCRKYLPADIKSVLRSLNSEDILTTALERAKRRIKER